MDSPQRLVAALAFGWLVVPTPAQVTLDPKDNSEAPDSPFGSEDPKAEQDAPPVVVKGTRLDQGYIGPSAAVGTRTKTSVLDTPASVHSVPEQVFSDQGVWRLKDVYRNVSGVEPFKTEGFAVTFESAYVRGFAQNPYINGTRTFGLGPVDLQGLESVEVLKGPASVLYGALEPGGILNLVPKTPSFTPSYGGSLQLGSYDYYRGTFDVTGPLGDGQNSAFRLNGAYQNSDSFRDTLHDESVFLAPSFTWNLSDDTTATAWMWYQHQDRPVDDGVAFSSTGQPVAPIETFLGDPNHNTQAIDELFAGVSLTSELSEGMSYRQELQYSLFDSEMDAVRRFGATSATDTVQPFYDASKFDQWSGNARSELLFDLETASVHHDIATGLQAYYSDYTFRRRRDTTSVPEIDIVNPNFPNLTYTINNTGRSDQELTFFGLYAQDHMRMMDDRLHLLVGARGDQVRQDNNPGTQDDSALTWNGGLLYEASPWLSPYVSVSTSFDPTSPSAMTANNTALDPERGIQYEAGAKLSLLDDQFFVTTSVYEITKEDVAISDPDNPGFSVNGGEFRSLGFELDIAGQVTPDVSLIGSYAYTDTEVVRSSSLPEGASFRGIPKNSASLWLSYDGLKKSAQEGLTLGAGVFTASKKAGDDANTFDLPSYVRFDAGAWYDLIRGDGTNARFYLNVLNLTDEEYYESSFNVARVQPGDPLTVLFGVSLSL